MTENRVTDRMPAYDGRDLEYIPARHEATDNEFDIIPSFDDAESHPTLPQTSMKRDFTSVTYIGNGYAAAIYGGHFVIVDLRRARERLLYESYIMLMGNNSSVSQQLLFPEHLVLSNDEYSLLEENAAEFVSLGFDIAFNGDGAITVKGIPAETAADTTDELIYELLKAFDTPTSAADMRREKIACTMACNASRTFGRNLTNDDAAQLLEQFASCDNMNFSPSGKAIMTEITPDEIRSKLG